MSARVQTTTRCPDCGFLLPADAATCPCQSAYGASGFAEAGSQADANHLPVLFPEPHHQRLLPSATAASDDLFPARPVALPECGAWQGVEPREDTASALVPARITTHQNAQIFGRVILIDNTQREPPDFDLCRMLTKVLWGLLLLLSPLALFGHTLVIFGPLIVVAGAAGLVILLRFLPLGGVIWFACLSFIHRRPDEQIPVCYARVRDARDQSEAVVRLKGQTSRSNVAADDLVSFWGTWHDGVLIPHFGYNHRTEAAVRLRGSRWWLWLILTLGFAAALAFHLHQTWTSLNAIEY
jgi:hypothetical protein